MRGVAVPRLAAAVAVASFISFGVSHPAAGQSAEEQRVEEATAALESVRAELEQAASELEEEGAALADAERRLDAVEEAVAQAEQAVQRQQRAVLEAEQRLGTLRLDQRERRSAWTDRVVGQYKTPPSTVDVVLGSESLGDALAASRYLHALARTDREVVEQLGVASVSLDAQREQLAEEKSRLERMASAKRALLADAEELRRSIALRFASKKARVESLEDQERIAQAERGELAALARRAARAPTISRSSAAEVVSAPAPSSGGGWVWPTSGPVTSEFGPRWGRMHEGIDIGAPTGAAIYASSSGVITHAGWMGGYGQLTLVDHGNGVVTAYAHQSSLGVNVGQRVSAGQVIGAVGATGNVTGPHLHFEARLGGYARDPREYLP